MPQHAGTPRGADPFALVDPWVALADGRAQLGAALDGLAAGDESRLVADAPGWSVADLVTHLAAWDELTAHFLRALVAGDRGPTVEAAPDRDWADWNAEQIAIAEVEAFPARLERLHAARDQLLAAAYAIDGALLDEPVHSSWGTYDSVRAYLIGQAMHDGMHGEAIASARS